MLLVVGMLGVPLVSLVKVDDAVPGVRVEASSSDDALDLERTAATAPSRSRTTLAASVASAAAAAVETTTTAVPPTTTSTTEPAPPTTASPTTVTAAKARPTSTTARPTTTTAKPAPPPSTTTTSTAAATTSSQEGKASFYDAPDPAMCAHRTLRFGTVLTITNLANGKRTTCRVGDRGPYIDGRIVDLSRERFAELAPLSQGVIDVRLEW